MHAVHFGGQGRGSPVGRVYYLWLKKKRGERGKEASALGWNMDTQIIIHFAHIQTEGAAYSTFHLGIRSGCLELEKLFQLLKQVRSSYVATCDIVARFRHETIFSLINFSQFFFIGPNFKAIWPKEYSFSKLKPGVETSVASSPFQWKVAKKVAKPISSRYSINYLKNEHHRNQNFDSYTDSEKGVILNWWDK